MSLLDPLFASFTWGAGGSTIDKTLDMCTTSQGLYGFETCMHLTCTNVVKGTVENSLKVFNKCNDSVERPFWCLDTFRKGQHQ